jgi:hypothetical protein
MQQHLRKCGNQFDLIPGFNIMYFRNVKVICRNFDNFCTLVYLSDDSKKKVQLKLT